MGVVASLFLLGFASEKAEVKQMAGGMKAFPSECFKKCLSRE